MEPFNYSTQPKVDVASIGGDQRQPVASNNNWLIFLSLGFNAIILVVLVFALLRPPVSPGPQPGPGPSPAVITEPVAALMVTAERNLAVYEAEISEQLADAVLKGTIKDSKQFFSMADAATQKAREKAFAELNALNNKYISAEKWDPQIIAEFQRLKAEGKKQVAAQ